MSTSVQSKVMNVAPENPYPGLAAVVIVGVRVASVGEVRGWV